MLVVILDRVLGIGEEYDYYFDWIEQTYDHLERLDQNAIEEAIILFKSDLMKLCVDLLYQMPAREKYRLGFQQFMTANELQFAQRLSTFHQRLSTF